MPPSSTPELLRELGELRERVAQLEQQALAAEERMQAREARAQAIFEHAREGLVVVDDEGRIADANPAGARILGAPRATLRGRRPAELVGAEVDRAGAGAGEGEGAWEATVSTPTGVRTLEVERIAGIRPGEAMLVVRDVTERKEMLTRLALADRLISAGTLAGGLAHEIKTPLAYISANLQFLEQALGEGQGPRDAELLDAIKDAVEGTNRLKAIIEDLRTFVRTPGPDAGPADLEAVLRSCVGMTWTEIQSRARLERSLEPIPKVAGNAARLAQVFVNLLVNAIQAIPEGAPRANRIRLSARRRGPDRVAVEVSDTGTGIAPEVLPRIFEPFFTTKGPSVGTGLGLSICRSIVEGLGGTIEVQSEPGHGSTFRVVLPVAAEAPRPGVIDDALVRARVLVVEEALEAGEELRRLLADEHDVTVASPDQARERIAHGERFDAVLAEVPPEHGAVDLRADLVRHDPRLAGRVVILQGGAPGPGETPAAAVRAQLARVLRTRPGGG